VSDSKPLIAIVDDEPQVRRALRRLLSSHGYQVEEHPGAASMMAAQADHPADCLVLDLHMPEMSGFQVLEALASTRLTTPVIVITAHAERDIEERVLSLGAAAFLSKPVKQTSLLAAIESCLSNPTRTAP